MEAPLLHERRPRTRAWVIVDVLLAIAAIGALASGAALVEVSGLPSSWPWDDGGRRWPAFASAAAAALLALVLLGRLCFRAAGPPDRSPLDRASFISRCTFWWVTPTLSTALRKGTLDLDDLPELPDADQPHRLAERFARIIRRRGKLTPLRLLVTAVFSTQRSVFAQSFLSGWVFMSCMFLDPILLSSLLRNPAAPGDTASVLSSLGLVLLLTASMFGRVTCMEQCYYHSSRTANNARAILVIAVFRASVRRAGPSSAAVTGRLTNLMATDADRIGKAEAITWLLSQWSFSVLTLPLIVYMMHTELGASAYVGVGAFLASSLLATALSYASMPFNRRMQECRDARGALLSDLVKGIGVLKARGPPPSAHACEAAWHRRVSAARTAELRQLKAVRYLGAATSLLCGVLAQGTPFAIFSWYVLVQHRHLDAATAFVALAWIQTLQWSINALPSLFYAWAFLAPSLRRLCDVIDAAPPAENDADAAAAADPLDHNSASAPLARAPHSINAASVPAGGAAASAGLQAGDNSAPQLVPLLAPSLGVAEAAALPRGVVVALRGARLMPAVGAAAEEGGTREALAKGEAVGGAADEEAGAGRGERTAGAMEPRYREVELQVAAAELLVICGAIGSGKSTLLAALAFARPLVAGRRAATPRRAYVAQRPFLLRASVKQNVLFGEEYDRARYEAAIEMAALQPDLAALPQGDETPVGEGGAALSGGQRARVAFARAAYAHADALFLDDVFAAVDAHVGRRLWASVAALLGAGRAVVLVTHQVQVLARPQVTRVALLSHGNVVACGPCDGAMRARVRATMAADAGTEARPGAAATLAEEHEHGNEHGDEHEVEEEARAHRQSGGEGGGGEGDRSGGEVGGGGGGGGVLAERGLSHAACVRLLGSALGKLEGRRVDRRLIARTLAELSGGPPREDAELKREGLIAAADFAVYLREFGSLCARTLLLLATVVSAAASVAANLFLEEWTKPTADGTPRTDAQERASLGVYVLLGCGTEVLAAVQTVLLTICSLRASRVLHATLLRRLLHAPMAFFDAMASGAILNRFLSDTMNVDSRVPDSLTSLATQVLTMVTQLGLVLLFAPWVALATPLLGLAYYRIYQRMRAAARDARRIGAMLHSPVFSNFADVLAGRETIASFGAEARMCAANERLVHAMSRASIMSQAVQKWAQALTVQTGCVLYLAAGVVCVLLQWRGLVSTSVLGLVLLYAGSLQRAMMDLLMRLTQARRHLRPRPPSALSPKAAPPSPAQIEVEFVSVERIAEFTRLDSDDLFVHPSRTTAGRAPELASWASNGGGTPPRGRLELVDVWLRYRPHESPVLCGLSLDVRAGTKLAVCGRSGCGKTSLLRALARLYPIDAGALRVDGLDLCAAPLAEARSAVRLVAQESIFLEGTLLENVLAFDGDGAAPEVAPDARAAEVWRVLGLVGLRRRVEALPAQLHCDLAVADLSEGERQLLSLSRGLLARGGHAALRLLLCDEPTASVDVESDERVHSLLLGLPCTVIVLAHRLHKLRRFDQAIVIDEGRVAEQGAPDELLGRTSGGRLAGLWKSAGLPQQP